MIAKNLVNFLTDRNWTVQYTTCMFHTLAPPPNLISKNFALHIPQNFTGIDFTESLNEILHLIAVVYNLEPDVLKHMLENESVSV